MNPNSSPANTRKRLRILFLPADSIEPAISRSAYMARGLSRFADVYYLTWHDPRSAGWQGRRPRSWHSMGCVGRTLFRRFCIEQPDPDKGFYRVSSTMLLDAFIHRIVGRVFAAKLKYAYNGHVLDSLVQKLRPDVVFYGDGFYYFPLAPGDHLSLSDIQDDIGWPQIERQFPGHFLQVLSQNLSNVAHAYIVSEAAGNSFNRFLPQSVNFLPLPNGADFDEIRAPSRQQIAALREKDNLNGKYVISYIGGEVWFDLEFASRLFIAAAEVMPEAHFVIVGNLRRSRFKNVTWVGPVPPSTAAAYYNLSDAGAILRDGSADPFLYNSVPLKIIQYAAAQKPVVGFLPDWAASERFPNLFDLTTSDTQVWCDKFQELRRRFIWTSDMEERWKEFSWDAICSSIYNEMAMLCEQQARNSAFDSRMQIL